MMSKKHFLKISIARVIVLSLVFFASLSARASNQCIVVFGDIDPKDGLREVEFVPHSTEIKVSVSEVSLLQQDTPSASGNSQAAVKVEQLPAASFNHQGSVTVNYSKGNPYFSNKQNRDQAQYLEKLGVAHNPKSAVIADAVQSARRANVLVDEKIRSGVISEGEAIWLADVYVGHDGRLAFVRAGEPRPEGSKMFLPKEFRISQFDESGRALYVPATSNNVNYKDASELFENADFFHAISNGFMPYIKSLAAVSYTRLYTTSPDELGAFHDFAHSGGFDLIPRGMPGFRKAARTILERKDKELSSKISDRMFFVNELLMMVGKKEMSRLKEKLRTDFGLRPDHFNSYRKANKEISRLDEKHLWNLANAIYSFHPQLRKPFGGTLRTGRWADTVDGRLDLLRRTIRQRMEGFKSARIRMAKEPSSSGDRYHLKDMREAVAAYIVSANALSRTDIEEWFRLATSEEPLRPESVYYRYLCDGSWPEGLNAMFCK